VHSNRLRRAVGLTAVALTAVGSLVLSAFPATAAPATSHNGPTAPRGAVTVQMTVVRHGQAAGHRVRPDGTGPVYSLNCGTAQLIVNGSNARYNLKLHSILGTITQGTVVYTTDGFGNVPQPSGINLGSTYSNNLGTIAIPGIFISNAYATGQIYTSQGDVCFYTVFAPW